MSMMSIDLIMWRIKSAEPRSPIAVFIVPANYAMGTTQKLNAVFAATVESMRRINSKDSLLIGVYDKTMDHAKTHLAIEWAAYR